MSTPWKEEDDELRAGGVKEQKPKPPKTRFSFNEVRVLLNAVKKNRYILLGKFNQGVSAEAKKQTWSEITNQVNDLGENHREVRQIMKKWTDLKCDGKRRIVASRGPNGCKLRRKNLGPVERMVHKILVMGPTDEDSDPDLSQDESFNDGMASSYSYLNLNESSQSFQEGYLFDLSPLSSPEKELGEPLHSSSDFDLADDAEPTMDFDENDDSVFPSLPLAAPPPSSTSLDPLPDNSLPRMKPVHTYSRTNQNHTQHSSRPTPGPSSSAEPPPPQMPTVTPSLSLPPPPSSSSTSVTTNGSAPAASSASIPPAPPPPSTAPSSSNPSDPLPSGWSQRRPQEHVVQFASQSLQQQRASRMLLTSVSRSLETLAQSVQLLVESQQEFVQESLLLQRETVDVLRDFSNTTLSMLRDKTISGQLQTRPPPPPPPPLHHLHPMARF